MAEQNPNKGPLGQTRQGIYCLTASGKLLAFKNSQEADAVREMLEQGLAAWNRLPERERRPGAVKVPNLGKIDRAFTRTPPPGGLILNVFTRILDRKRDGQYVRGSCSISGGELPGRDHLWLKRSEWQSLIPPMVKKGDSFDMPSAVADRLLRYHLVDNTRGEPPFWASKDIRKKHLRWTVLLAEEEDVRLRLEGSVLLATDANPAKAKRGYEARLFGYLHYDRVRKVVDRLDVVAVGEHWGEGDFTRGARPGRKPLGIALELVSGERAADKIPPQAARNLEDYLGHD
ncbi:MAG: hypothetical protein ACRELF_09680 [Gemmataceae bacterium]